MRIIKIKKWLVAHRRFLRIIAPFILLILGVILGIMFEKYLQSSPEAISGNQLREDENGVLIKPLLLCGVDSQEAEAYSPLQKKMKLVVDKELKEGQVKKISVYFRDLDSGRWVGVNENERYAPASMLKVPIMIVFYKMAESHPEILQQKILYDGSFDKNSGQEIKPKEAIQPGKEYTIDELTKFMIIYSDNNAAALLDTRVDEDLLQNLYAKLEIPPWQSAPDDFLSPKLYSRFFRILYNATYLSRDMSQKALDLLTRVDFSQGISAGVPSGTAVAQKFGERVIQADQNVSAPIAELHNCGIIYHNHPYAICIMTKGDNLNNLEKAIQNISSALYQEAGQ